MIKILAFDLHFGRQKIQNPLFCIVIIGRWLKFQPTERLGRLFLCRQFFTDKVSKMEKYSVSLRDAKQRKIILNPFSMSKKSERGTKSSVPLAKKKRKKQCFILTIKQICRKGYPFPGSKAKGCMKYKMPQIIYRQKLRWNYKKNFHHIIISSYIFQKCKYLFRTRLCFSGHKFQSDENWVKSHIFERSLNFSHSFSRQFFR